MPISDYRLPVNLAKGAEFGPEFNNVIVEALSGTEQRQRNWSKCRAKGDLGIALRKIVGVTDQLNYILQVRDMFHAHYGDLIPFRFRDPFDNQASNERFGTGDGSRTAWQLTMTYDPKKRITGAAGTVTYVRDIFLLEGAPTIKINDSTQTLTTDYTISSTAEVTFTSPPSADAALTWSTNATGWFELPCRFDTQHLALAMPHGRHAEIGSIPIREVIGARELA